MRIRLFLDKPLHESAAAYYEEAKEVRKKAKGVEEAIEQTKKELKEHQKKKEEQKKQIRIKAEKKWFEKFHYFMTSGNRMAIGGRNAQQNDLVFSKHMDSKDLFFHADIQGGTALIVKDGTTAMEKELKECAQFAASFSKAWDNANAMVDVYSVKKEQLSKHAHGGYIPAGAFAIIGRREWYRNTPLGLRIGMFNGQVTVVPECSEIRLNGEVLLKPSKTGEEKGKLAKTLARKFVVHADELLEILPNGKSKSRSQ
jgi:predicted ribosome quality control (RQC) complex YloA/Tae2 family protein